MWDYIESFMVELYNVSDLAFLMAAIAHLNWSWKYSMSSHMTSWKYSTSSCVASWKYKLVDAI